MARKGLIVVIAALFTSTAAWAEVKPLRFKNGTLDIPAKKSAEVAADLVASVARDASPVAHVIIQFEEPITDSIREKLEHAGITVLDYLSENAFFAAVHH